MKTPKPIMLLLFLWQYISLTAQVQWYQNQDGGNIFPNGTYTGSVQSFTSSSFVAVYLWYTDSDQYTWKISRSAINGTELKTFFVTGTAATVEVRTAKNQWVYVLKKDYPAGQPAVFTLYKLNASLQVLAEQTLVLPDNFVINSINTMETDDDASLYLAGDGSYPEDRYLLPVSFVIKKDKNLVTRWVKTDSTETSYTRVHIDNKGKVLVLAQHPSFYPMVKMHRFNANGSPAGTISVSPDAEWYNVSSMPGKNDELFLFGGKTVADTAQAVYLCRVSLRTGQVQYRKTYFTALVSQLADMERDNNGKLYSLIATYAADGSQYTHISRINPANGQLLWNQPVNFETDSTLFSKLVTGNDRIYAVGEKRCNLYFAKGYALRLKHSGQRDGNISGPDSVQHQRYHALTDAILNSQEKLIAVGNTNDMDTVTFSSTYYRAFAVLMDGSRCNESTAARQAVTKETEEPSVHLYPNPVQSLLTVSHYSMDEFDKIAVHNMQGAIVLQQKINTPLIRLDVGHLTEGVYLLVLRSSVTFREKTYKFVVSK